MKKINIAFAAIAAMTVLSCNKEMTPSDLTPSADTNLVQKTFYASYGEETKVAVDEVNTTSIGLKWESGDQIHVLTVDQALPSSAAPASNISGNTADFTAWTPSEATTYYAVYPASAVATTDTWVTVGDKKALRVTIPAEQQAVHNSFDPKAYVATAVTTNDHLTFKPAISAIKFQLGANAADVEKVEFQINGSNNAAGTGVLYTDAFTTHAWLSGKSEAFSQVTLSKPADGFQPSTDYYITFRPNRCTNGITLYIAFKDGTIKKVTSTKKLFGDNIPTPLGAVKSFGDIVGPAKILSAKDAYDLGFDLKIGDVVLNKASIASNDAVTNGLKDGVVNFVDGTLKLSSASSLVLSKDTYIVGDITNNTDAMDSLVFQGKNIFHRAGVLGLKNIALNGTKNTNYLFSTNGSSTDAQEFILDGCSITTGVPVYTLYNCTYTCKKLCIIDTDVCLTVSSKILFDYTAIDNTLESVTIQNSIFYSSENYITRLINAKSISSVVLNNNTIFNLHAGNNNGLIHCTGTISSLSLNNNLFSFYSLNSSTEKIVAGTVSNYSGTNNAFHKRSASDSNGMILYGVNTVSWAESAICATTYPFTSKVAGAGATR